MFEEYNWQAVTGAEMGPFLELINSIQNQWTASSATASVEWCQLPFYTSIALVRVNDTDWPDKTGPFWFLSSEGRIFVLDGTAAPIHYANEAGPVKVTEGNALDYLRFFCNFVHGPDGPFVIVEKLDHPAIDQARLDPEKKKILEDAIRPAAFEDKGSAGDLTTSAMMLYRNALFVARFRMTENGMIEMIADDPVVVDLPVKKSWSND